jgi:hypothetical protein
MDYTPDNAPAVPSSDTPATMPTAFPAPKHGHAVALAVTLSLVGVLLVIGITLFIMRMRRARLGQEQQGTDEHDASFLTRKSTILDPRHPASHINPFNSELLIFCGLPLKFHVSDPVDHKPGTMRIARRRVDGAWDFEDPEAPFHPHGVGDPSPVPPGPLSSKPSTIKSKVTQSKAERDRRRDTNSSLCGLEAPPPAYHREHQSDDGYANRDD